MSVDSSKIKKLVKSITFSGKKTKWTSIKYGASYQPRDQNDIVDEEPIFKSNMVRHADFERAMDRFKVHLMVRCGFAEPLDKFGKLIDREYFNEHLFESDARFQDVQVTGILVTTKKDLTGFQIVGSDTTVDGQIVKLKSPVISTIVKPEGEGYNYPLQSLADEDLDSLVLEALEFMKGKGAASSQLSIAI